MCGFAVVYGAQDDALLQGMLSRIKHRGPDGQGEMRLGEAALGHVRLAIVDVASGAQPMTNERRDLAITFNGEIYNHLELRRPLEGRHQFRTRSDTEVLLHLYEEQAEDMLSELDGMFALALAGPQGLMLARDRMGIKPLYYGVKGSLLLAASEIKAFPPMDELHALPPGHFLYAGGAPAPFARTCPATLPVTALPVEETLPELRRRLQRAVEKRLMGDVPVGVYLSGGLDSSLVAAMMRPHCVRLHSFTAGMEGAPDLAAARAVAEYLDLEHHELLYTEQDVRVALPEVIRYLESFDAPLVRSAIPMYFVSRLASKYVKVVLTGEGADELFAGYAYLAGLGGGESLRNELINIIMRLENTNLQRADRMTMVHGIEGRVPFLDRDLVSFVMRLPTDLIEPRPERPAKWLLREACKGVLPAPILSREKLKFSEGAGSSDVIAKWLRNEMGPAEFNQAREQAAQQGFRSPEELYYYGIWRKQMGVDVPPDLVGRTSDLTAAA